MRSLKVGNHLIADDQPCYVIAEIGGNHGGSVDTALQMIRIAAACGVQAVKFQCRDNATLYSPHLLEQPYENENSYGKTYGSHRDALELSTRALVHCMNEAVMSKVDCFATAFDEKSVDKIMQLGMPAIKIASGGLTDLALLRYTAQQHVPIILSTGGGTMKEIDVAVETIANHHTQLAVLHCTAAYPVRDYAELNLRCIQTQREAYPTLVIGWSGHDSGIAMSLAAYTLGARIIEKHFTTNRANKGTDHAFSLEPSGLQKLCRDLQRAHAALGDGTKRYLPSEVGPISKMRRRDTQTDPVSPEPKMNPARPSIETFIPREVGKRDWGREILVAHMPQMIAKVLMMKAGTAGGLQYHREKVEAFFLDEGQAWVDYDAGDGKLTRLVMAPGMTVQVPAGATHRVAAITDCKFFEVSTPVFNDRVRCEAEYGEPEVGGLPTTA